MAIKVPTDTQWADLATKVNAKQNALTFDSIPTSGSSNPVTSGGIYTAAKQNAIPYGVCSTAAATVAKEVSIPGVDALTEGLSIRVKFANQNTASSPTLQVNSLTATSIKYQGTSAAQSYEWASGEILDLVYDGTNWIIVDAGRATTSYYGITKLSSTYTSASTSNAATTTAVYRVYQRAIGTNESYTIATSDWTALSNASPYTYSATVTATTTIGTNTIIHLRNDQPVAFANYGFAVASASGQAVTIYSIGQPTNSVTLKINYKEGV